MNCVIFNFKVHLTTRKEKYKIEVFLCYKKIKKKKNWVNIGKSLQCAMLSSWCHICAIKILLFYLWTEIISNSEQQLVFKARKTVEAKKEKKTSATLLLLKTNRYPIVGKTIFQLVVIVCWTYEYSDGHWRFGERRKNSV